MCKGRVNGVVARRRKQGEKKGQRKKEAQIRKKRGGWIETQ